ncbi:sulfatase-like hydrolase/transferase [bacterium]|nr:sulfatase-like hydrolase/transferase [bacterium]
MDRRLSWLIICGCLWAASVTVTLASDRPNILWITSEDNSISWVSCYGSRNARTPNIDRLAAEGFRYTHCFDNAAVCAPTRSTWITGHYAISLGTQPMRSRYAIPHELIPYYSDQLKKAGYFVGNGGKTDYNIGGRDDKDTWKGGGPWEKRQPNQPFFTIKNIGDSHESRAFPKANPPVTDPAKMVLHAYHPDLPDVRQTYARYADAVANMDRKVGETISSLKKDGLYEDTIIIYCSDHGGVIARSKRFLYSSGTHCPLIVRIPEKWKKWWPAEKPGMTVDRIVSFVDMPKTWLSLAEADIPKCYQGRVFLGPNTEPAPKHHLSFRERADEACDMVRGMRDERFAYIKNYMPWAPNGQQLRYMYTMKATEAWHRHHQEGKTDAVTGRFFRPRVSEEFYDTAKDFDNVHNLIDDPKSQAKIAELRAALRKRQLELFDSGLLPEAMRVRRAEENNVTIYEMVRDPKLYPLERYLDLSDLALARDPKNLDALVKALSDADEAIRYWGICGLFLLEDKANPARDAIEKALQDEAGEVCMMATWAMDKMGHKEIAKATLEPLKTHKRSDKRLYECLLRWMGRQVFVPGATRNSRPARKPIPGLITKWKIIGPFDDKTSNKLEAFAPAFSKEAKWTPITKGVEPNRIDIQANIGEHDDCSAFVRTTVTSPEKKNVTLVLQADDLVRAVLNGQLVEGDQVELEKGENELILKVVDHKKGWRFTCAFRQQGKPVKDLIFEAM